MQNLDDPRVAAAGSDLLTRPPAIRLFGKVDDAMLESFLGQLAQAQEQREPAVLELSTAGGNAETARRIAQEVRLARRAGLDLHFLGKTMVYSSGMTVMAAFPAARRALSADAVLLLHERHMDKEIKFAGALRASLALARNVVAELEIGQRLEREGFEELVAGSRLSLDDLMAKVMDKDWYVPAHEALQLGLVARLI